MRRSLKYLLVIAVLLALALAVSLGIAAATAPSTEICYVNLSLKMTLEMKYAVAVKSIPAGAEVGVTVHVGAPDSDEVREAEYEGVTTINGASYRVYSIPVNATEYSTNLYAKSYIKNGATISYGEEKRDSAIKYVRNMSSTLDEKFVTLLDSMLNYGAEAQKYFDVMTDRLANADFYEHTAVNGTFSDGYTKGLFAVGESVTVTPTLSKGVAVENWKNSSGQICGTDAVLTVTAPAKNETYTANLKKSDASIEYVLDGGTLPEGKWTSYPDNEDFTLPVPTKSGYLFCGWYTEDGYGISKIPAGSDEYFVLTAKWSKIAYDKSGTALYSGISRLSIDNYNDNDLVVAGDNLVWKQGVTAISQITVNGSLPTLLSGEKVFTLSLDLALEKGTPCFSSTFRFRQGSNMVTVFKTNTAGEVSLGGSGPVVAVLSEQMQRIRIVVDFNSLIFTAYSESGDIIGTAPIELPAGLTGDAYYASLTSIIIQSVTNKPLNNASALVIGGVSVNAGNSAKGTSGLPISISSRDSGTDYTIVYDSDSEMAENAAGKLARL